MGFRLERAIRPARAKASRRSVRRLGALRRSPWSVADRLVCGGSAATFPLDNSSGQHANYGTSSEFSTARARRPCSGTDVPRACSAARRRDRAPRYSEVLCRRRRAMHAAAAGRWCACGPLPHPARHSRHRGALLAPGDATQWTAICRCPADGRRPLERWPRRAGSPRGAPCLPSDARRGQRRCGGGGEFSRPIYNFRGAVRGSFRNRRDERKSSGGSVRPAA